MRKSVVLLLGEVQRKMSGYAALLNYRFMNLCVNAEPASLMPVTVEINGEEMDIEEVADVAIPQENQLGIYPKDPSYLHLISKAILLAHPEFKLEQIADENDEEDKMILCTMPVVNKDRRDLCMEGVRILSDETKVKMDLNFSLYTNKIMTKMLGDTPENIDEAKKMLEDIYNGHTDLCKEYQKNKEDEIEKAYQRYLTEQETQGTAQQEQQAARGNSTSFNMKIREE